MPHERAVRDSLVLVLLFLKVLAQLVIFIPVLVIYSVLTSSGRDDLATEVEDWWLHL